MGSSTRNDVLMNTKDAQSLDVRDGQEVLLRSDIGEWIGVARLAPMKERHLQAYWPECNVLISRRFDAVSGEPDYNALVTVEPRGSVPGMTPARVVARQLPVVGEAQPEPMGSQRVREPGGASGPTSAASA